MERTSKPVTSMSFARSQSVSKNHPKIGDRDDRTFRFSFSSVSSSPRREKNAPPSLSLSCFHLRRTCFPLVEKRVSPRERKKKGKKKRHFEADFFSHRCSNTLQMISHQEVEHQSQTYGQRTGRVPTDDALSSPRDYCHCNPIG